ncbi:hypothetical protein GCM10009665_03610 [Kitasatospora nipponensis]|uniref:Cytochrome bc1 complex Rieske iron-sulfur subunit n=1 Tax=Kitasatospora nipponensis TaxID=258049 RepID=A0ABP4GC66_9ACTN
MSEAADRPAPSRRTLLCCGAAVLAGGSALALSGCASSTSDGGQSSSQAQGGQGQATKSSGPVELGPATDVPVGGGKVYREQRIVVTQPSAGQYHAFSARCTHAGCVVDQVKDNLIQCPCHGSRFNIADGTVAAGPAPTALPSYQVAVADGKIQVTTA